MTLNEFNTIITGSSDIRSIINIFLNSEWSIDDWNTEATSKLEDCRQLVYDKADGFSVEQLNQLIVKKLFTFEQLMKNAQKRLDPNKIRKLSGLNGFKSNEQTHPDDKNNSFKDLHWDSIEKNDRFALDDYIKNHPNSEKVVSARRALNRLGTNTAALIEDYIEKGDAYRGITEFVSRGWVSKQDLISIIGKDKNLLSIIIVKQLMDENVLSLSDIREIGFSKDIVRAILGKVPNNYQIPTLAQIVQRVRVSNDFYFWGTTGSGKSCALGAILSAANNNPQYSFHTDRSCQGDAYMEVLQNIFKNDGSLGVLPPGTQVGAFAELGFDISDIYDKKIYHITCIDMAGGVLDILSKKQLEDSEKKIKEDLVTLMENAPKKNRCHHVFLLEYRKGDTSVQADKLDRAINHLKEYELFKKTEGITVLVTKVDRMDDYSRQTVDKKVDSYISDNFLGFRNGLEYICKKNHINNGKIEVLPFNIGNVEMQNYCIFDDFYALQFINKVFLKK